MGGKRIAVVIGSMMVAAVVTVVTTTWTQVDAGPDVVRLHLGSDGQRFSFGTTTQALTVGKNSSALNSAEPLIDLSSSGAQSAPGLANYGIGVKESPSSGNGSPCAQVAGTEG